MKSKIICKNKDDIGYLQYISDFIFKQQLGRDRCFLFRQV